MHNNDNIRYLNWLLTALSAQRIKLVRILKRLSAFKDPSLLKPLLFRKFLGVLEQISIAQEKENAILHHIELIEAKHRFWRQNKALKYARKMQSQKDQNLEFEYNEQCKRPSLGWLWLLAFWIYMTPNGIHQKKQSLTAD